ncbi:MAG: hypothetical protein LBQ54_16595, partial [Planctomycetaceae bacterium]|nr:hypothetical protein [Planctomycetaceae bacterium]
MPDCLVRLLNIMLSFMIMMFLFVPTSRTQEMTEVEPLRLDTLEIPAVPALWQQQVTLNETLWQGTIAARYLIKTAPEDMGITPELHRNSRQKMEEVFLLEKNISDKYPYEQFHTFSPEKISDMAKDMAGYVEVLNSIINKTIQESFPAEAAAKLNRNRFQRFGGIFGGAFHSENLAVLNLTPEQKEKADAVVQKFSRERLELLLLMEQRREQLSPSLHTVDGNWDRQTKLDQVAEEMKWFNEKLISLALRGQREIEAILTDAQKDLAEKLMTEVPEEQRFLADYLAKRPKRLEDFSWKPGDGVPENMDNYPGEVKPKH